MLEFFSRKKGQSGFTLIELLVVIAIIGILATIVLVSLNTARSKARDVRRVSDLRQMALALEMYYDSNDAYPVQATCTTIPAALESGGYIAAIPADPGTTSYAYGGTATSYTLLATLENADNNALDSDIDGTSNACACADPAYCVSP